MAHTFYNKAKKRKATLNEIAKYRIIDAAYQSCECMHEKWGCENLTDTEVEEILRFHVQHSAALNKKFGYLYQDIDVF